MRKELGVAGGTPESPRPGSGRKGKGRPEQAPGTAGTWDVMYHHLSVKGTFPHCSPGSFILRTGTLTFLVQRVT